MGCDIHETYEIQQEDGSWKKHDYRAKYQSGEPDADGYRKTNYDKLFGDPLYIGRCYRFFAFLADVRNGSGFAGCDTGDAVVPIDEERGLPDDPSEDYAGEVENWDGDGHSHSWFTAEELANADWDQETTERCIIDLDDFPKFMSQKNTDGMSTCGGVSGGKVVILTVGEAASMLANDSTRDSEKSYHVRVEYKRPLKEELQGYFDEWLPAVLALHPDPAKIRVSFFFDN